VNEPLQTTLADAASLLQARRNSYALIGGLASSYRGRPRVTADVGLVIDADVATAIALAESLGQSKFQPLFPDVADVIERALSLAKRLTTIWSIESNRFAMTMASERHVIEMHPASTNIPTERSYAPRPRLNRRKSRQQEGCKSAIGS
jgi:hypothetical protein